MEFEEVLDRAGGFGFFNKTVMLGALFLATFRTALTYFGHLFVLLTPPSQWCFKNDSLSSFFLNVSTLPRGKCQVEMSSLRDGGYGNVTFVQVDDQMCDTGWVYDPAELFTTITMENQWVCGNSWKFYNTHTSFWVGSMCGYMLCGFLADRIGRKNTILLLTVVGGSASVGATFFSNLFVLMSLRFATGVATYTMMSTMFVIVMEYTVTRKRTFVSFIWATSWTVTASIFPWYAYLLQSWRGILVTNTCLDVLLFVGIWWIPESSGWLLSVGRRKEALAILERISRVNGKPMSQDQIEKLLQGSSSVQVISSPKEEVQSLWQTTLAIMKNPRIRRITLLMYAGWFAVSFCYNAYTMELGRLKLNVYSTYSIAMAFEIPINLVCIMSLDKLGRRWPNVLFMFVGGLLSLAMGIMRSDSETLTLVMAVVILMTFAGGMMVSYQVAAEVFPTVIRGRAVLLQSVAGGIGGLSGTRIASLAEYDPFIPVLVMGGAALVAAVLLFFVPDSVDQVLPQTIEDGENFARDQSLCFCPIFPGRKAQTFEVSKDEPDIPMA